ncbi:MAG: hypothetical protein Q4A35_00990 [Candidatus Gracilibacteria bacterium]|nr:hypothetical protein [Candidatus Gracilibacteria bacterium]
MDEVDEIFSHNGSNLEIFLEKELLNRQWKVETNQFYLDTTTGKPRETDVVASSHIDVFGDDSVILHVRLFFECKYLSDKRKIGLFTKQREVEKIKQFFETHGVYEKLKKHNNFHHDAHCLFGRHRFKQEKYKILGHHSTDNNNRDGNSSVGIPGFQQLIHAIQSKRFALPGKLTLDYPILFVSDISRIKTCTQDGVKGDIDESIGSILYDFPYIDLKTGEYKQYFIEIIDKNSLGELLSNIDLEISALMQENGKWFHSFKNFVK